MDAIGCRWRGDGGNGTLGLDGGSRIERFACACQRAEGPQSHTRYVLTSGRIAGQKTSPPNAMDTLYS